MQTHTCTCTSVLPFLLSQGWCWGPHFIVMGYTRVPLICRPAHCLGTWGAWQTSRPSANKRLQSGGWYGKSKAAMHWAGLWPDTGESISRELCECRSLNTRSLLPASLSPRDRGAKPRQRAELQLLTAGQIWLFRALNPDLHKQFLASSASSLRHRYHPLAIWLSAQHWTHCLSPLKKKFMENSENISVNYFPKD